LKLHKSQYWSREEIRRYQFTKLSQLLDHAFTNVPYYRKIAEQLGITFRDIRSLVDLQLLPALSKEIIRNNFDQLMAVNIPEKERIANATGGSTGEPLHFFQDKKYDVWADAARLRGWYQIAGCDFWDPCAVLWGAMHEVKADFTLRERVRDYIKTGEIYLNAFNLSDDRKMAFIKMCRVIKPKLIRGYFSAVKELALFISENKLVFPPVKGVILCAETVDDLSRAKIEEAFKSTAFNSYGGRELSLIAMECEHKNGLHEVSENNYVEYEPIDLQGYERAGNLLITNLNNYAMPFIRYRIGDIGIPSTLEKCACGRGLPLIERVIGRTTEVLTFKGGIKIAGEMFIHLMKDFPVREYQFVQVADDRVQLRYPVTSPLDDSLKEKIRDQYKGYLPEGVLVEFVEVDKIEKTVTGKFRFVLREEIK
jgi:phenylacetate-CoA ligase